MSLIQQLKQAQDFTEREKDIARFVLEHPDSLIVRSILTVLILSV